MNSIEDEDSRSISKKSRNRSDFIFNSVGREQRENL